MGEKIVNVNIRFPESIRDRVKAFAVEDRRSMNSEIIELLEEAMTAREASGRRRPSAYEYPSPGEHQTHGRLMRAADRRPTPPPPA